MSRHKISKPEQVKTLVLDRIRSTEYGKGDRFPSDNELCSEYGMGRSTVREAVTALVHDGFLTRVRGSGTFATGTRPFSRTMQRYALILRTHGHVYHDQSLALIRGMQTRGGICSVLDSDTVDDGVLRRLMRDEPLGTVLSAEILTGMSAATRELLEAGGSRLVFINECEANTEHAVLPDAVYVLRDPYRGIFLATRHLAALGHERILLVSHPHYPHDEIPFDSSGHGQMLAGYKQALREAGIERSFTYFEEYEDGQPKLEKILTDSERPTAVVADSDNRAVQVMAAARAVGLRVPEDLAVVGHFNTPWCELSEVPLTSVSIRESYIADLAVRYVTGEIPKPAGKHFVYVEPELVVRRSCGAVTM